ncbi:HAF repeat-containing protein [Nakamurella sp.]|uniref:HAF repeat-containing protein n=1 Tax=Nakamurella sp. TaxID=1869182 RepID=UPI003B3B0705
MHPQIVFTALRRIAAVVVLAMLFAAPAATTTAGAAVGSGPDRPGPARTYHQLVLGFPAVINDLNDAAVVVGESGGHAFSWRATTRQKVDLGTLGGPTSIAYGINDRGQIVGTSDVGTVRHAFRWDPADHRMTDLGTLGGSYSTAYAVNNRGLVVGESETADGRMHAFSWDPRTARMSDLGTLGGDSSTATAVNDSGQIVGNARTGDFLTHAFRWDPRSRQMRDLGVLPGSVVSFATGINNRGEVVGYTNDVGDFTDRAFRWDPRSGQMQTIAGLPDVYSHATGINDLGRIAGYWDDQSGRTTAFVWSPSHQAVTELPQTGGTSSGYTTTSAINNRSWVAGQESSAALWIPST